MTLKEYIKIHRPENIDDTSYKSGVVGCPYQYGEFAHMELSEVCRFNSCTDCWNQEYLPNEGVEMGTKKYIIEIPEETSYINAVHVECGDVVGCKTITLDLLKPYENDALYRDGRRDGQSEVWDFTYEIFDMYSGDMDECFGTFEVSEIMTSMSYREAKEKYDTYIENKIKVGDEITDGEETGYVLWIEDKECMAKLGSYDCPQNINLNTRNFRKTGRHNPKLAEVMREISET